jgi:hypothetical protein
MLMPAAAAAQTTSAIAGVVKDTSGAVLPGVTVEASSPALIERVRSAVTDGQGQYKITELRPGTYSVTFTLSGFSVTKRDGIELTANFTAAINVELSVGALTETVTVSGQSALVDVQNVNQQKTFSRALLDTVPTNKGMLGYAALVPAVVSPPNAQDVGGSKGELSVRMAIHGGKQSDQKLLQDGMRYNAMVQGGTGRAFFINPASSEEIVVALANGGSGEAPTGGVMVDVVPKDGGNRNSGYFLANYAGNKLQGDNIDDELRARGLKTVNGIDDIYDLNGAMGGPLRHDKVWWFSAHRHWGQELLVPNLYQNATPLSPTYTFTPDFSNPVTGYQWNQSDNVRVTWKVSERNKVTVSHDFQFNCPCTLSLASGNTALEAANESRWRSNMTQSTWTYPATDKLLFSAGATVLIARYHNQAPSIAPPRDSSMISVVEQTGLAGGATAGFRYIAPATTNRDTQRPSQTNERFSVAYVTGSHNFKTGIFYEYGHSWNYSKPNDFGYTYTFRAGVPFQITESAGPILTLGIMNPDFAWYAQDQWTMNRLTLSMGLRFDWLRTDNPAQSQVAGPLSQDRSFPSQDCLPCWKDINPRLGVSYDVFGNGRTALKASLGRYVVAETAQQADAYNFANTSVNSVTRSWTDTTFPAGDLRRGNFVPDCDLKNPQVNGECGAMSDAQFGQLKITTHPDPDALRGWGKRQYNWQFGTSIEQQLRGNVAVSAGFYRTWYGNFGLGAGPSSAAAPTWESTTTDNLLVTPADYQQFCVTAPVDPRLGGVSGGRICGLYDLIPSKFGQVDNLVTFAKNYGKQTEYYNGADVNVSARLLRGAMIQGGMNWGNSISNTIGLGVTRSATNWCFVVDNPEQMRFCEVKPPYQPRLKVFGSVPLAKGFQGSANFQSLPGAPIAATWSASNAVIAPGLGRNLSSGTARNIELLAPNSVFERRINQLDLRLSKTVKVGAFRIQGQFDCYNALNANPVLSMNTTFGPSWLTPTQVLDARMFKVGVQFEF